MSQLPKLARTSGGVRGLFEASLSFWHSLYTGQGLYAAIYQDRLTRALSAIDKLGLPAGARVLDVGCGAGFLSLALAKRGLRVTAVDLAEPMLRATVQLALQTGATGLIDTAVCDSDQLPCADSSFALVVAIGLLPWVLSVPRTIRELVRVLQPNGYILLSMDNRFRLNYLLHPYSWARNVLDRWRDPFRPLPKSCSIPMFDEILLSCGLKRIAGATVGFGPFWLLHRLSKHSMTVHIHRSVQRLADLRFPIVRSSGAHYVTLSQRIIPAPGSNLAASSEGNKPGRLYSLLLKRKWSAKLSLPKSTESRDI